MRKGIEWWVGLVGVIVLGFLFFYNRQGDAVYTLHWLGLKGEAIPRHGMEEYLLVNTAVLLWIPVLVLAFLGKGELSQYGLARGEGTTGALMALGMYLVMLPLVWLASTRPEFQHYYPLDKRVLTDPRFAVYFELVYGYYLFCWEFFFRGFLTFGLSWWMGKWGVVVQAVAFGLMHLGKPLPEVIGSFAAGLVLGWVALRVRSFLPCFWAHWAVSVTLDVFLIFRNQGAA